MSRWIESGSGCRVVAPLGMGGMGKTALSVKLAQQFQEGFEYVVWQSLRHAPSFTAILIAQMKKFLPVAVMTPN